MKQTISLEGSLEKIFKRISVATQERYLKFVITTLYPNRKQEKHIYLKD